MKDGFTLIELMAVVTILAILSLIIVPIIDKNIKKSKDQMYKIQIENVRLAGMNYYSDNINLKPRKNETTEISLTTLVSENYIAEVKNPKTNKAYTENIVVRVTNNDGKYTYLVCPLETNC